MKLRTKIFLALTVAVVAFVSVEAVGGWKWNPFSSVSFTRMTASRHLAIPRIPLQTLTCNSGPIQIDEHHTVVQTPDCSNASAANGTREYMAWLEQHRSEISAAFVSIYTLSDPEIVAEWISLQRSGIQLYVEVDYSELQAVGAAADKKAAAALKAGASSTANGGTRKRSHKPPKKSEHQIANDLCSAGAEVVWGTSPADNHSIMHLKLTILFDKDGKPHWMEDGSFNYTHAANLESNDLHFSDVPKEAAIAFNQWLAIHDAMITRNRPFWSTDNGLPATCPALSTIPLAAQH